MMEKKATYKPPYTVSGKAMTLMTEIAAAIERYRIEMEGTDGVRLRKLNHIRTIRGTTAIEGNTLTENQITALLAGKRVAGSAREIAEIKCAHNAYAEFEFEFIHPFPDGNGRTGRLWQTALLGSWRREFYAAPIENIVWAHQQEYYAAIREASDKADSGPFIDFMLDKILRTLKAKGTAYENKAWNPPKRTKSDQKGKPQSDQKKGTRSDQKIWEAMKEQPGITIAELMRALGMSESGVKKVIRKLKDANLIRRTGPDKGGRWEVC